MDMAHELHGAIAKILRWPSGHWNVLVVGLPTHRLDEGLVNRSDGRRRMARVWSHPAHGWVCLSDRALVADAAIHKPWPDG